MAKNDDKPMDRRGFLKCMAWVGTGAVWTMSKGSGNNAGSGRKNGFSASQLAATERPVAGQIRFIARAVRSTSVHVWSPARPSKCRSWMSRPLQSPTRRSVFPFCSGARTSQAST